MFKPALAVAVFVALLAGTNVAAQEATETAPSVSKPAPYDDRLLRLSEILGALHFLRNLCIEDGEPEWRGLMDGLLAEEAGNEPERKAKLTAAFNRGYRTFAALNNECSPQLRAVAEKYRAEGATLAGEITARYGN